MYLICAALYSHQVVLVRKDVGRGIRRATLGMLYLFPVKHISELTVARLFLLPGTIVNKTYGTHKNLYVSLFLPTIFGPVNYGPP